MKHYFPYLDYRKNQELFMNSVFDALLDKKRLLIHAPTGVGKTVSVLAPALKFAVENDKVVFFLTSRNTQHKLAIQTLKDIKKKFDLDFIAVDLVGKKKMCSQENIEMLTSTEFVEYCKMVKEKGQCEYFNIMKKEGKNSSEVLALLDELKHSSPDFVDNFCNKCDKYCPYEMALLLSKKAKVIVADYNFILNPSIRLGLLLKMNKKLDDCILIFDEAHNLPSRARELLSVSLSTNVLKWAANEAQDFGHSDIKDELNFLRNKVEGLARDLLKNKEEVLLKKGDLIFEKQLVGSLNFVADDVLQKKQKSFASSVARFLESWPSQDEGFSRIFRRVIKNGKVNFKADYLCLTPAFVLEDLVKGSYSFIGMSGTLNPLQMYVDLLGLVDYKLLEFPNPFPKENRLNIILPQTSTKFKSRSEKMYEDISLFSSKVCNAIPGNVVVFFPSYSLRDSVAKFFIHESEKTVLMEDSTMDKGELFDKFSSYKEQGAVLLAVVGGSFSEGVDFCGDLLNGVVVVGLPLAPPNLEIQELINYYDRHFGKGWDYGYIIPALIKAIQSSGRCIRSETDKGVVVFLDERYVWKNYFECFPKDWHIVIDRNPVKRIEEFFR